MSKGKAKKRKSVSKRIRITKRGKLVRRPMGISHSRTRKSRKLLRKKIKTLSLDYPRKAIVNY